MTKTKKINPLMNTKNKFPNKISRAEMKEFIKGHADPKLLFMAGLENYPLWYVYNIALLSRPNQVVYLLRHYSITDFWERKQMILEFQQEYY